MFCYENWQVIVVYIFLGKEQNTHSDDYRCFFSCDRKGCNSKNKKVILYPNVASALQFVLQSHRFQSPFTSETLEDPYDDCDSNTDEHVLINVLTELSSERFRSTTKPFHWIFRYQCERIHWLKELLIYLGRKRKHEFIGCFSKESDLKTLSVWCTGIAVNAKLIGRDFL